MKWIIDDEWGKSGENSKQSQKALVENELYVRVGSNFEIA